MKPSFGTLPLLPLLLLLAACGQTTAPSSHAQEAWNAQNDPLTLRGEYERTLASLPASGELTTTPWSDTYWLSDERPDFLWTQERPAFTGYFARLGALYELSQTGENYPEPL